MKYVMLNSHIVCVNDIRNTYMSLGDIYIDFKNGNQETLKIYYSDVGSCKENFLELCKALKDLEEGH